RTSRLQSHRSYLERRGGKIASRRILVTLREIGKIELRQVLADSTALFALLGEVEQHDNSRIGAQCLGGAAQHRQLEALHVDFEHIDGSQPLLCDDSLARPGR